LYKLLWVSAEGGRGIRDSLWIFTYDTANICTTNTNMHGQILILNKGTWAVGTKFFKRECLEIFQT